MIVCGKNLQRDETRGRPKKEADSAPPKQVINLSKKRVTAPKTQTSQKSPKTQTRQKSQAVLPKQAIKLEKIKQKAVKYHCLSATCKSPFTNLECHWTQHKISFVYVLCTGSGC